MPRTVGVISTPCIRLVARRGSIGIPRRILQRDQIHIQHVLQDLQHRHVEFGTLPIGCILFMPITLLLLERSLLGSRCGSNLERSALHQTNFLSHRGMINDSVPNSSCFPHVGASVLMKLVDNGSQIFLSLSQVLDKSHLAHHLSHHLDFHCGDLSL